VAFSPGLSYERSDVQKAASVCKPATGAVFHDPSQRERSTMAKILQFPTAIPSPEPPRTPSATGSKVVVMPITVAYSRRVAA